MKGRRLPGRTPDACAVEESALALDSREELVHDGVEHHAHHRLLVDDQADGHAHERELVHEVGGAVQRVHHPCGRICQHRRSVLRRRLFADQLRTRAIEQSVSILVPWFPPVRKSCACSTGN